jgi:uncharacterized membrane protein YgcG
VRLDVSQPQDTMMNRIVFLILITTFFSTFQGRESCARSLYWQDMSVEATLTNEGRLLVREQQTMVFTGDWNGGERTFFIAPGQTFSFTGISRETQSGGLLPLQKGNLKKVNNWNWASADTLRWRSRLPGDPPFSATPITYVLEYRLGHILNAREDGSFQINHDFAFPNRSGEIQNFRLTLHLGNQWRNVESPVVIEQLHVPPGHSVFYTANLLHDNPEVVEVYEQPLIPVNASGAATAPAPGCLVWSGWIILLLLFLYLSITFYRHEIGAKRFRKGIDSRDIDEEWLNGHVFSMLPETVGATWDKTTDGHEVAAVLARLVLEGKMTSRLEDRKLPLLGWKIPGASILHLELQQPRTRFKTYERSLIDGFFIDGDKTDTKKIRQHYRKEGKSFRPADKIRYQLKRQVKKLTASNQKTDQSKWLYLVPLGMVGVILLIINGFIHKPEIPLIILGGISGIFGSIMGGVVAFTYQSRSDHLVRRSILVHLVPLMILLLYTGLGLAGISSLLTLALLCIYATLLCIIFFLARTTDSQEGVALRQELSSARKYLAQQLQKENPWIKDDWFPYLLAFGLGPQVDKWTKQFLYETTAPTSRSSYHSTSSSGGYGFSGGGGRFGGAGASGTWAAAATSLGTSASSSSSGSSGGGGGSSGGGGGGGW